MRVVTQPIDGSVLLQARDTALHLHPHAGCVATSWRVGGREVLALPAPLDAFLASARTGGIPLLYPYANRLRTDRFTAAGRSVDLSAATDLKRDAGGLPMHGLLLRWGQWDLRREHEGAMQAALRWSDHAALMRAFPFAHSLRLGWRLHGDDAGARLEVTTEIHADGGMDVPVAFGWHPYLAVGDPGGARVHLPPRRPIALDAAGLPVSPARPGAPRPAQAIAACGGEDALFDVGDGLPVQARVSRDGLDVVVGFDRPYHCMQLYSPRTMPGGTGFVCLEPMTGLTGALSDGTAAIVPAGGSLRATFHITATRTRGA